MRWGIAKYTKGVDAGKLLVLLSRGFVAGKPRHKGQRRRREEGVNNGQG